MSKSQQSWVRSQHPVNKEESEGRQMNKVLNKVLAKNSKSPSENLTICI
jgi:hypothetical protein